MSDGVVVELVERDIVAFEKTHHQHQVHPIVKLKNNKQTKHILQEGKHILQDGKNKQIYKK